MRELSKPPFPPDIASFHPRGGRAGTQGQREYERGGTHTTRRQIIQDTILQLQSRTKGDLSGKTPRRTLTPALE